MVPLIIPSGSIASRDVQERPWWGLPSVFQDEIIPFGTLAMIKPMTNGIIRNEWAGEIVIVLEKIDGSVTTAQLYRVASRYGVKVISSIEFIPID